MESEERECREYEADLVNRTGERETIEQMKSKENIGMKESEEWH